MKLVSFSVENYRSIIKANRLPIGNSTILIGPNNEGKSNILRALVAALRILNQFHRWPMREAKIPSHAMRRIYDWETDFPVALQTNTFKGETIFRLEIELSDPEILEFWTQVGSHLNGTLPIQLSVGKGSTGFKVLKRGRGAATLSGKANQIARFVSAKLDCVYIPAVRTASSAQDVVEQILADELGTVEENEDFKRALTEIAKVQQPVLDRISSSIKTTLKQFLPNVKDVKVTISQEDRSQALRRSCQITIDDGTPTRLQQKGDGVQSLAALCLMRHASERGASGRQLILAIEEPESHLHPRAIHQLKQVVGEIANLTQVIITTHCPTFVDRVDIKSNIIVSENKAVPAKSIKAIREILGVKAADNLQHAELVLVVEGENDRIALSALLAQASAKLKSAIVEGTLALDTLAGGSNLSYKLTQLRDALCNHYVFLDDDDAGRESFEHAKRESLLTQASASFAVCLGMIEAEIEDMYEPAIYADMIKHGYGVTLETPKFSSNKKWSTRMSEVFRQQGKQWTDPVKAEVKAKIADLIAATPTAALNQHKRTAFDSLVTSIETKLDELAYKRSAKRQQPTVPQPAPSPAT